MHMASKGIMTPTSKYIFMKADDTQTGSIATAQDINPIDYTLIQTFKILLVYGLI